jgi:acyl-CoA thioesterase I
MIFQKVLYPTLCLVVLFAGCSTDKSQESTSNVALTDSSDVNLNGNEKASSSNPNLMGDTPTLRSPSTSIRILYLGDSITAGFGIGQEEAFPHLVQLKAQNAGLSTTTIDAGVSGDTSTGGLNRIDWLLKDRIDVLVLELGGNDGLRGVDLTLTSENLAQIIIKTKAKWPESTIVVAGMMVPPNLGHEYTEQFRSIFPALATAHGATLIPFVLEGVGGIRELNQPDGIHPTANGHKIIAETVWETLEPLLRAKLLPPPA